MLRMAVVFFVIALIAGFIGFVVVGNYSYVGTHMVMGEAGGEGAKILFVIFLSLAVLSFLGHGLKRRSFWGVRGDRLSPGAPLVTPRKDGVQAESATKPSNQPLAALVSPTPR